MTSQSSFSRASAGADSDATIAFALASINELDLGRFVGLFGGVFEHAPWVAEAAWSRRPFDNVADLHDAMMDVVLRCSPDRQTSFLCLHPELAGREATEGQLTPDSEIEQASAGLHRLSSGEMLRIGELNRAYRERHGFPFIICVRYYTKQEVFVEFERRIARDTGLERQEALSQVSFITRLRLQQLMQKLFAIETGKGK